MLLTQNTLGPRKFLKGPDKKTLPVVGYIKANLQKKEKSVTSDIYVLKGATALLDSSVSLGVVALVNNVEQYPQLFKGLGEMPQPYSIKLEPEVFLEELLCPLWIRLKRNWTGWKLYK